MMSDRSGIGLVELSALETLETLTAGRTRVFPGSDKVLAEIEDRIGLGPRYAYDVLLDLARPWRVPVRLVDFQGGSGDRHFPADDPEYARCRLSLAGQLALDAEAHRLAPVPAGLINGTTYRGGTRPPLEPFRALAALGRLLEEPRLPDGEILGIVGPPDFLTGCAVSGDLAALAEGQAVTLRLASRITVTGEHQLNIVSLPPDASPADVYLAIVGLAEREAALRIDDVKDISTSKDTGVYMTITLQPGTDPEATRSRLAEIDGVVTEVRAAFPAPLTALLRSWVERHRGEDLTASLAELETAIHRDQQREVHGR
jgi:hypothetical protein